MHPLRSFFSLSRKPFPERHSNLMRKPQAGGLILFMGSKSVACPVDGARGHRQMANALHLGEHLEESLKAEIRISPNNAETFHHTFEALSITKPLFPCHRDHTIPLNL